MNVSMHQGKKNNGVTTVNFDVIFDSLAFTWLETLWIPQSGGLWYSLHYFMRKLFITLKF